MREDIMSKIETIKRSYEVCEDPKLTCDDCPYKQCDFQKEDIMSVLDAITSGAIDQPGTDKQTKKIDIIKVHRLLYTLNGRLEAIWSFEKDDALAAELEISVDDLDNVIDALFGGLETKEE